jgi:broad specificity phosphatase PhoE
MPTTILLIRHPESAWNKKGIYQGQIDTPLSPLGRLQAELVGARLSHERVTGVLSSPLKRALALAKAIARYHHLPVHADDALTEISHGSWEGFARDEVKARFPDTYDAWISQPHEVTFPKGESLQDVHDRAVARVSELLGADGGETWVVVTHDTIARLVIAAAWEQPVLGFSSVSLENAAITTLVGPSLVGSVRQVNDVGHLGRHRVDLEAQAL